VSRVVLDASALLTLLNQEPGAEKLTPELLTNSVSSTVNLAEVQSKLVALGIKPEDAWQAILAPLRQSVDFDQEQARIAGGLITETRQFGLSLGDRACLALGIVMKAPVYTADRLWKNLKIGIRIHVVR